MKVKVLALSLAGVLLLGGLAYGGVRGYQVLFGRADDGAVELVPRNSFAYASLFLNPSMDQQRAIRDLLERFPTAPTVGQATNQLAGLLDGKLEKVGATFSDDIEPWLGRQVAAFAGAPSPRNADAGAALLIASDDDRAARAFVTKAARASDKGLRDRTYRGVSYRAADGGAVAIVDGYLAVGNERGIRAVIDTSRGDSSLADSDRYESAVSRLTEDRLVTFYFDPKSLGRAFGSAGMGAAGLGPAGLGPAAGPFGLGASQAPVAGALYAASDKVVFETTTRLPDDRDAARLAGANAGPGLLAEMPSDSWGAFGVEGLGDMLGALYNYFEDMARGFPGAERAGRGLERRLGLDIEEDLLSWMGDAGLFVHGTRAEEVGGALVIESSDPEASGLAVKRIEELARRQGASVGPLAVTGVEGFAVRERGMPQPLNILAAEDLVVVAYGDSAVERALDAPSSLEESELFRAARVGLGSGFEASGFFDLQAILRFAENAGAGTDPEFEQARSFLEPLSYVVFGSRRNGDRITQRVVLGVR